MGRGRADWIVGSTAEVTVGVDGATQGPKVLDTVEVLLASDPYPHPDGCPVVDVEQYADHTLPNRLTVKVDELINHRP